jgi:D-methionine transport system substrate-binding protein
VKKLLAFVLAALLVLPAAALAAEKVSIGATPVPHAEILEFIKPLLAEKGFDLEIVVFNDYVLPNQNVESGDLNANYFQHTNYLFDFNANNGTHLVPVIPVHFEPMGVFKGKTVDLTALPDGASIGVPNDPTNEARALLLLEGLGVFTLDPEAGITATKLSIVDNPKKVEIVEAEAAQLPRLLQDLDLAVINGNYALEAGLSLLTDTVGAEGSDALVYKGSVNYVVVKEGDEETAFVEALREALNAPETQAFILDKYQGSVVLALDTEIPVPEAAE